MHDSAKQIFNLMFRPNETVCVSFNKYGYHSIPVVNAMNGPVVLVPTEESARKRDMSVEDAIERVGTDKITMCSLNPIKGFREDINCTAYRSFLIEMDYGPLPEQIAYVKKLGMPYSAAIFSGNKSIHFLITLDTDLPSEKVYRVFSEWILGVVTLADQNTKNPSRSIRIPGAYREPGKKQILVEFKGAVKIGQLVEWLNKHPEAKPKEKKVNTVSQTPDFQRIKPWVCKVLMDGIMPPNRNKQWFTVGVEFALAGYSEDDTIDILRAYYSPDNDFKEREWETTIKSAFKYTYERKM